MRIIEPGKLPEEKLYTNTCNNCKCVFEFKRGEANFHSDYRETWTEIKCPTCNKLCFATYII